MKNEKSTGNADTDLQPHHSRRLRQENHMLKPSQGSLVTSQDPISQNIKKAEDRRHEGPMKRQ